MDIIRVLLLVVEGVLSLMLIGLILLQKSKSEGLGLAFGGGAGESLFGARAGNVLTRMTIYLGIAFLVNTLIIGVLYSGLTTSSPVQQALMESRPPVMEGGIELPSMPDTEAVFPENEAPLPDAGVVE